jgi:Leucine-rich repeat (LRR) protein
MKSSVRVLLGLLLLAIPLASCAVLKLRDGEEKRHEGDSSEWVRELKALQKILPDDREWAETISNLIHTHRGEILDVCTFTQVGCTVHREIESLHIENAVGRVAWHQVPATVIFLAFDRSRFTQPFSLKHVPEVIQSLRYRDCVFDVDPKSLEQLGGGSTTQAPSKAEETPPPKAAANLHEIECRNCSLTEYDWTALPPILIGLDLSQNRLVTVQLEQLPKTLRFLNLSFALAPGVTLQPWGSLPPSLISLDLSASGVSVIRDVPVHLQELVLRNNQLTSPFDSTVLPSTLQKLNLAHNKLEGDLPMLKHLSSLREVDVSENRIEQLKLSNVPSTIVAVRASHNQLVGTIDWNALPRDMTHLELGFNMLVGRIDLTDLPKRMEVLDLQSNHFGGPIDFTRLPETMRFLYVQNNQLTGRPDLAKLPVDLRRIMFGDNSWTSLMPPR